jgi:hypothetical protein
MSANEWLQAIGDKDPLRAAELFLDMLKYSRGRLM